MGDISLEPMYRLTVSVPTDKVDDVVDSVREITDLGSARYDSVHWIIDGVRERFRPLPGSNPARGRIGELHEEPSCWLVLCIARDDALLTRVLESIRTAHPWESPALFVDETRVPG